MKYTVILILLISVKSIQACECPEYEYSGKHVRQFFHWYDKVFIGNLLESKKDNYRFEVIQGFKNCEFRDTLWGKYNNSCSIVPNEDGLWIVYASIIDSTKNEIDIDACNSTRNLKSNQQYLYDDYNVDSELYKLKQEQSYKLVELSILENLHTQESISQLETTSQTQKSNEFKPNINSKWIAMAAIILSLIAILMNIQTRRKASR